MPDLQRLVDVTVAHVKAYVDKALATALGPVREQLRGLDLAPYATKEELSSVTSRCDEQGRLVLGVVDEVEALRKVESIEAVLDSTQTDSLLEEVKTIIEERFAALPAPEKGEPGANGKDAEPVDIELLEARLIKQLVQLVPSLLPPARDGKDVDLAWVERQVNVAVGAQLATWPRPKDGENGKDASKEEVNRAVAEAVAALPLPKEVDEQAIVEKVVAYLRAHDLPAQIAAFFERIEPTRVSDEEIAAIVDRALNARPVPKDGKDADPAALLALQTLVNSLAEELKALRALPVAPTSFLIDDEGELQAVYSNGGTKRIGKVHGANGKVGEDGASVMDGKVDAQGMLVLRMSDGRIINAGIVKERGEPGKRGADAAELRPLAGIDDAKSYAEGIYARHRGGLVRADRQTDPLDSVGGNAAQAGWAVVLEGIAAETETVLDSGRVIQRETVYTSGKTFTRTLRTGVTLFRGVWKEGRYEQGDQVARAGSMWLAMKDTTAEPGNGSSDWVLSTKRGQNGRDAITKLPQNQNPIYLDSKGGAK